ncbi:MAG: NTPase, partial [Pyrobaculum sp.]
MKGLMSTRKLLGISGMPGVGKTTLVARVVELARPKLKVCGFLTFEVRERDVRVGFDVVDISTGQRFPLARVGVGQPSVGRYVVHLDACRVIDNAIRQQCDLLVADEIGAMEFKCPNFSQTFRETVATRDTILATVHRNYIQFAKSLGFEVFWLTREN